MNVSSPQGVCLKALPRALHKSKRRSWSCGDGSEIVDFLGRKEGPCGMEHLELLRSRSSHRRFWIDSKGVEPSVWITSWSWGESSAGIDSLNSSMPENGFDWASKEGRPGESVINGSCRPKSRCGTDSKMFGAKESFKVKSSHSLPSNISDSK